MRIGERVPVELDNDMAAARQDVHARVRAPGMGVDGLVLFQPLVHGVPLDPHGIAQRLDGRVAVVERRPRGPLRAGHHVETGRVASAR